MPSITRILELHKTTKNTFVYEDEDSNRVYVQKTDMTDVAGNPQAAQRIKETVEWE